MRKTLVEIELGLPALAQDITIGDLRTLHKEIQNAQACTTNLTFLVRSDDERRQVSRLRGFVHAHLFGRIKATRLDFGAAENFRFKWDHAGSGDTRDIRYERRSCPGFDRREG